ncbi:hypothetical protein TOT_010000679 [Theileria orientalis strain Shintoku]|uniref:Uncharacterized protein n=1 Tax=Theileria orientalis strain Shintoku TaxID=869250 RepID=J4DNM5_THEOR|nr:hypothetical protein TOT_010000679 [Theileria orientalis strain Shintoku]BAM39219.1 hypothetical protein TOT_010000679 [Theileria orientalis strain Shintoku]|eukprot:XP_009689520.1 hypothetical protein TOT_010000679 [Theileria orientalis strain Shintoku]
MNKDYVMESQDEAVEESMDKKSMLKGFSKAFSTISKKSHDKVIEKKHKKPEEDDESVASVKVHRKTSVRVDPSEYPEEQEKKYKRIATKGGI